MSIVAVHGPNTFGGTGAGGGGTGMTITSPTGLYKATADPTNGLKFTFEAIDKTRPPADYDWTFPGGTPATQADSKGPVVVTFATAGSKTISLAIAAGAGPPATGTYPMTVQAVSGPRSVLEEGEGEGEAPEVAPQETPLEAAPGEPADIETVLQGTVDEVKTFAEANPDFISELYEGETAGQNRSTLVTWLEQRVPFDPAGYTVTQVIGYAEDYPAEIADIIAAERAGKNRTTLINQLESMQTA